MKPENETEKRTLWNQMGIVMPKVLSAHQGLIRVQIIGVTALIVGTVIAVGALLQQELPVFLRGVSAGIGLIFIVMGVIIPSLYYKFIIESNHRE